MFIVDMRINGNEGLLNDPDLIVVAKDLPKHEDLRFEERKGLYVAENDGYVSYIYKANPAIPDNGFSRRYHQVTMKNGKKISWYGGWSSRASHVNDLFPELIIMDVIFQEPGNRFSLVSGAMEIHRIMSEYRRFLNGNVIGIRRVLDMSTGSRYYTPFKH